MKDRDVDKSTASCVTVLEFWWTGSISLTRFHKNTLDIVLEAPKVIENKLHQLEPKLITVLSRNDACVSYAQSPELFYYFTLD